MIFRSEQVSRFSKIACKQSRFARNDDAQSVIPPTQSCGINLHPLYRPRSTPDSAAADSIRLRTPHVRNVGMTGSRGRNCPAQSSRASIDTVQVAARSASSRRFCDRDRWRLRQESQWLVSWFPLRLECAVNTLQFLSEPSVPRSFGCAAAPITFGIT